MTSAPDLSCQIVGAMANWPAVEAPDTLLAQMQPAASSPVCFAIWGTGTAQFSGVAGLTSVAIQGADSQVSVTPLAYVGGARSTITGFTAQAVLNGTMVIGRKKVAGTLYTKDAGVIGADGRVGEILKIVGGSGGLENASGTIAVAGQEVGGVAIYTGEVCLPN